MSKNKKANELSDAEVFRKIFPKQIREKLHKLAVKPRKKKDKK